MMNPSDVQITLPTRPENKFSITEQTPLPPKVALICMPWSAVCIPSFAIALLKRCVQASGFNPEIHYLNIRFAERLGLDNYERLALNPNCDWEWAFAQALFGPSGLGELQNGWEDIKTTSFATGLVERLRGATDDNPDQLCEQIANFHVPEFIDGCLREVDWGRYLVVGFTTMFAQSLSSLLLAKRIKERYPEVNIVFGGANVDSDMGVELLSGCEWIDYVVHGEGENSFLGLLRALKSGDSTARIPGVSMRRGGALQPSATDALPVMNLNSSPTPDYSDYLRELDRSGFRNNINLRLYFESSRGCWWGMKHHCTFCGLNGTTMAFRKKDASLVYSEIMQLSKDYGCLSFAATDNIIATDYFKQLLPQLAEADTDIRLFYEVKANLSREQVQLLASAGVKEIQPGIESFNSRVLQLMRKGVTAIQNIQLLKWCREFDITPTWNLLYGFPGETPDDYRDTPRTFRLLTHLCPPFITTPITFERFSPYFFDKEKYGLRLTPWESYRLLFPQSRVNLHRIAYFFDGEWEGKVNPEGYIGPVQDAWRAWVDHWRAQNIYCFYEKGPGFLVIHDNRPRLPGAAIVGRRVRLSEKAAALYLFCDEAHSFRAICDRMRDKFGTSVHEHEVREWLTRLVNQGLMFQEDTRYLALAIRTRAKRTPASTPAIKNEAVA